MSLEGSNKDWAATPENEKEFNFQLTQYFVLPNEPQENDDNTATKEGKLL